ncbi:hypothetical protein NADFUDRAFT_39645 [Nadsonia fulvescens var. elongata DSM 6958]|uniref:Ras-domain-containing protein n=1 Tax=Nadsonia fulvescens var. elongata DSM 6958 TaxID=857566 RepID=A0A1E3PSE2_9ASCO|nr:hypothetical protein NADFUDRAFT_39645 [Nadsonia fulvescens var. elongata DSM 6958]
MTTTKYDFIAKIVMIGDSSCGKSSLTIRLTDERFLKNPSTTLAAEIGTKIIPIQPPATEENSNPTPTAIKLQIWDTAGQETYRALTRSYFRNAAGCLLVYDITRRETFEHARDWLIEIRDGSQPHGGDRATNKKVDNNKAKLNEEEGGIVCFLVGNKLDVVQDQPELRQVGSEEAQEWAKKEGLKFIETSAKTGHGVVDAYEGVAREIWQQIVDMGNARKGVKANRHSNILDISKQELQKTANCC